MHCETLNKLNKLLFSIILAFSLHLHVFPKVFAWDSVLGGPEEPSYGIYYMHPAMEKESDDTTVETQNNHSLKIIVSIIIGYNKNKLGKTKMFVCKLFVPQGIPTQNFLKINQFSNTWSMAIKGRKMQTFIIKSFTCWKVNY